jgi:hypothetical protein
MGTEGFDIWGVHWKGWSFPAPLQLADATDDCRQRPPESIAVQPFAYLKRACN